jgi:hypothetical protein
MKIQYIIMFQFILALFGCKKAPSDSTTSTVIGPFTIETITRTGKTWNMNSGRGNYTNISYAVQYKGKPLQFSDKLETNTGLPGIWRVFVLKDAPVPTLILGSQSLYLVTIENDQPVIKPLFEQGSDFAAIQWLDSEAGQPGIYREVYSSDEHDTEISLSGGRYMAISHAVVLDTKTFELFPFNTNNESIDDYYPDQRRAIAFSPDSTQVVYGAALQHATGYSLALMCYEFKTGKKYLLPYDQEKLNVYDGFKLYPDWLQDYFEWNKNDQGELRLQLKKLDKSPYKKGIVHFERYPGYQYMLYPVKETIVEHLYSFMLQELKFDTTQVQRVHEEFNYKYTIPYQGLTLIIQYGQYGNDLVLYEEGDKIPFEVNKVIIQQIGNGFNALLNQGKYQEEFTEVKAPE